MSGPPATRRPRLFTMLALGLVIAWSGCSFRIVRPAPPREEWPVRGAGSFSEVPCTSTPAPPIVDLGLAAGLGTLGFIERNSGTPNVALGFALLSIPFLASSVYGALRVGGCHRYRSAVADASTAP